MTSWVDDDFGGFAAARWPDLEAVAIVATLDPSRARSVTTESLAAVRRRWRDAVEDGTPTHDARAALLRRLAALPSPGSRGVASAHDGVRTSHALVAPPGTDDSAVPAALFEALRVEAPLTRATIAASIVWGLDDAEVAALAGIRSDRLAPILDTARARLTAAHREGLALDGLSPVDRRLDEDLARLVDELVRGHPGPPDPGNLVPGRGGSVPRRVLLVGAGAAAGLGLGGWWLARRTVGSPATALSDAPPTPVSASSLLPTDGTWVSTALWPARGSAAGDLGIRELVAAVAGRLLWAEDVGDRRLVVGVVPPTSQGSTVRVWSGAAGAPAGLLNPLPLARDRVDGASDVVTLAAPAGAGSVLLVLARPTVASAELSPVVRPTRGGAVERGWRTIPLREGAGFLEVDEPLGPATRVRCGDFDGAPVGSTSVWSDEPAGGGQDAARLATSYVSRATGVDPARLRTRTVVDSPAGGNIINPYASAPARGEGRVWVTNTSTPDGAMVRAVYVRDDAGSGSAGRFWGPVTVAAEGDVAAPMVRRISDLGPKIARFLVIAPGAARVRLSVRTPAGAAASEVTSMTGDAAIVIVVYNVAGASRHHLDLWDASGRMTYSGVPPYGTPLLDLA